MELQKLQNYTGAPNKIILLLIFILV